MELQSIEELLKFRKKLVKKLAEPMPSIPLTDDPSFDADIWNLGTEAIKQQLDDVDAQIRERTGGVIDPTRQG